MLLDKPIPENPDCCLVIKMVNNETLISGAFIDDEDDGMYLFDPVVIKQISYIQESLPVSRYHMSPWMIHSSDTVMFINCSHIITTGEVNTNMFDTYVEYINSEPYISLYHNEDEPKVDVLDDDTDTQRKKLQQLFDQNETNSVD